MTDRVVVGPAAPGRAAPLARLAEAVRCGTGPLLLVAADLQVHPAALADLTEDPRPGTAVLASRAPGGPRDLCVRAGRVVAGTPGTPAEDGCDATFVGALLLGPGDRAAAAEVAGRLAAGEVGDPLGHLFRGLLRAGVPVRAVLLDPWPWARGAGEHARLVQAQLAALDDAAVHALRLRRAAKADDAFVATFVHRPLARRLTPLALRWGLTPNQVTLASVLVGLAAATAFGLGGRAWLVGGAVLLQVSLVLDCVDGDVARYRRLFSPLGAWLDASTDRLKEFACYGGLAWGSGAGRTGWLLAAAMLTLQTARHSADYTFTAVQDLRASAAGAGSPDRPDHLASPTGSARAARVVARSQRASSGRPAVVWAKKLLHLGISERWAVLSLAALAGRPLAGLGVLLALGAASGLYVGAGRVLRTRAWAAVAVTEREAHVLAAQVDAAPLLPDRVAARLAGRAGGRARFGWARPGLLRVGEYAGLLLLASRLPGAGAAAFALLLVVACHHYDALYRVLSGLRPAGRPSRVLGLGGPGRLLAVAALALLGGAGGRAGLWVLAGGLGMLFLVVEPAGVLREVRSRPDLALAEPAGGAVGG